MLNTYKIKFPELNFFSEELLTHHKIINGWIYSIACVTSRPFDLCSKSRKRYPICTTEDIEAIIVTEYIYLPLENYLQSLEKNNVHQKVDKSGLVGFVDITL